MAKNFSPVMTNLDRFQAFIWAKKFRGRGCGRKSWTNGPPWQPKGVKAREAPVLAACACDARDACKHLSSVMGNRASAHCQKTDYTQ